MQATREKAATTNTRATDYLFTWKMGGSWPHEALGALVNKFESVGVAEEEWTCLAHKRIRPGDRAYLLKQGKPPRGIFGRGHRQNEIGSETEDREREPEHLSFHAPSLQPGTTEEPISDSAYLS